ncbi:unnamed protein product [Adineta ricciae]|uniref:Uncharacterized protein n=1 Tax=Adineta ricciae TaxID=249248 RepID=A0A815IJ54_ADIRI|nr:unnamed protein product [Adineta ricciae]CAF1547857.1 unnamed protein product [Adineta ricciae]
MINNATSVMPAANNITVTTWLLSCANETFDLNTTVYSLYDLYRNNIANVISNVSINNFTCVKDVDSVFEQLVTFTQAVSIQNQILLVSIYSDFLSTNQYRFNGLIIDRQRESTLSSVTTHNNALSDACSAADIAYNNSLCSNNLTHPVCTISSNRWKYMCSTGETSNTPVISGLSTWQLGLICSLSILFVMVLLILSIYFYRRYRHSKQIALSRLNLYDSLNFSQKTGVPQSEEFKRATMIVQPTPNVSTTASCIHKDSMENVISINENSTKPKTPTLHNQHQRNNLSVKLAQTSDVPKNISTNVPTIVICRSTSDKSLNQSKSITDESDSLNQSNLNDSTAPLTKTVINIPLSDENLSDEDAWMSILDVVNAELAILNEEDQIRVSM